MHIHADILMYVSNTVRAYAIWIALYLVHIIVHMSAVCASNTNTYINPYVCCMCFRYMHICIGRITDGRSPWRDGPRSPRPMAETSPHWTLPQGSKTAKERQPTPTRPGGCRACRPTTGAIPLISDPASAYVHVSEAHTTHIWIEISVCIWSTYS